MLKLNIYASLWLALMAGIISMSSVDYSVLIAIGTMIVAVLVANDWAIRRGEEE